jgi:hypothetical protein
MPFVERHIRAVAVGRAIRRKDLGSPVERSEAVRVVTGGGECFSIRRR